MEGREGRKRERQGQKYEAAVTPGPWPPSRFSVPPDLLWGGEGESFAYMSAWHPYREPSPPLPRPGLHQNYISILSAMP